MARVDDGAGGPVSRVPGLYQALCEREQKHQADHDRFAEDHPYYRAARSRRLLDALEAGRPGVVQGRQLSGWGIPKTPLRREQAFSWFAVSADDRVVPAESPEDV